MRILTRYILREVTSHAFIGVAVFTFVLFTRDLGRILDLIVRNSAPLPSVAEIFFFTLPVAFTYTIPMGVLVGILIGLSRLAVDSEITAMRASGIGVWTFLRIISLFAIVAWGLALVNSVYIAPKSQAALARLQDRLKTSQASFGVQPRVFYEGFPNLVLYVQDVKSAQGAAIWKGVFIADISTPTPRITLAQQGILISEGPETLHLHLTNGSTHEIDPKDPTHYQISTFDRTDLPVPVPQVENKQEQEAAPMVELNTHDLLDQARHPPVAKGKKLFSRWYWLEFHRRFSLPTACIVLALVGIPLGLSSKKGGKSFGFVLTIVLVFAYYAVSLLGVSLARQGKIPTWLGGWSANIVFFLVGAFLLWRAERRPFEFTFFRKWQNPFKHGFQEGTTRLLRGRAENAFSKAEGRIRVFRARFPMILDDYVLRDFFLYLAMVVASFLLLVLVFTLFELLGDILRNQISPIVVGEYLLNVTPYFLYTNLHLCILLAVLVTFGLMQRSNEITAIKATGLSIYRIVIPVIVASAVLAGGLFVSGEFYLPYTNKRQDALRNQIKGKPAQTYLNPDRKWIFGQHSNIYYYQFFDSDKDQFGNLTVFQFDPATFRLEHRVYADRAHWENSLQRWVCTQGWQRDLQGPAIADYRTFDVATFPNINEPPQYFKKEVKQSSEMSYEELRRYIRDLQQSGFDVVRLQVQLHKKLAFPIITIVMAVLAIPFSLFTGKYGATAGVAVAVGTAIVYIVFANLCEGMGNATQLPPLLAAWFPDVIFGLLGGYLVLKVPT